MNDGTAGPRGPDALVRISVRRIKVAMASACPFQDAFALAHVRLSMAAA